RKRAPICIHANLWSGHLVPFYASKSELRCCGFWKSMLTENPVSLLLALGFLALVVSLEALTPHHVFLPDNQ
ncbi:hypothetical protein HispidOSU_027346, partial [Sigmodon hispidus]